MTTCPARDFQITEAECGSVEGILGALRRQGWFVAVHNDFEIDGMRGTFWLLTHPKTHLFVRGESCEQPIGSSSKGAYSDREALLLCCGRIRMLPLVD